MLAIIVVISPLTKDSRSELSIDANRNFEIIADEFNHEYKALPQNELKEIKTSHALTDSVDNSIINKRSIDITKSLDEMEALLKDKDYLIEALSLLVDIYENNPLLDYYFFLLEPMKSDPEIKCCKKGDRKSTI